MHAINSQQILRTLAHTNKENYITEKKETPASNQIKLSLIEFYCTCMALICVRITLQEKVSYSQVSFFFPYSMNRSIKREIHEIDRSKAEIN
jgi:hypothetical protein